MVKKKITEAVTSDDALTKRWRTTFAAGRMAYDTGDFRQAESLIARAKELAQTLPESSFALQATEIGHGAVLLAESKPKEAVKRLEKAMTALESHSDNTHTELLAVAIRFHAQAQADLGDERLAEKELKRSAEILTKLGPDASVQLAYTLSDLCGLYLSQGRHSEVEQHIMKVMKILSEVLGPDAPEYTRADMIYQLSLPMQSAEKLDQASDGIRRMEYAFGNKHPNIARALDRYFKVLDDNGDKAKIEEAKEKFNVAFAHKK